MDNIKHIFFDLDHTIWDFDKNSQETLGEIFEELELGKQIESFDRFIKKYRQINKKYWKLYRQNKVTKADVRDGRFKDTVNFFKLNEADEVSAKISDMYVKFGPTKTNLFPFAHDVLSRLSKKYQLHIITNGFVEVQHIKLERSDLTKYFQIIVCSEETGKKKPHKDVFNLALNKANALAEESVMIGDGYEADVKGALKVGMDAIWFNPVHENVKKKAKQIKCLSELSTLFNV